MLPISKHLHTCYRIFKRNRKPLLTKALYSDKGRKSDTLKINIKDKTISVEDTVKESNCEEIETVTFAKEEEILKTVITEKERDANVQSRLSKECSRLLNKRISLSSSGLNNLQIQQKVDNTCWENYVFNKAIDSLKERHTFEAKGDCICPDTARSTTETISQAAGSGEGPTITANRIVRREPGKVLFAFIPEEWFHFFIPKTGVTGFGTFLFTFGIYLVSKEIYVLEHNYYNGLGMIFVCWGAIKYVGPLLANYLDKEIDSYEKSFQKGRDDEKRVLEEQIEQENLMNFQAEGQLMLVEAKKENVHLQLEEEFRKRQMIVYKEVVNRLDYQVAIGDVYRKIFHKNLVQYVTAQVRKSITPDMEQKMLDVSIGSLLLELEKDDKNK